MLCYPTTFVVSTRVWGGGEREGEKIALDFQRPMPSKGLGGTYRAPPHILNVPSVESVIAEVVGSLLWESAFSLG